MFNLLAGAFMSFAAIFGALFSGHASSTPPHDEVGSTTGEMHGEMHGDMHMGSTTPDHLPGIIGTVTAVSGTTLTVQGMGMGAHMATTTYTVDTSNAKIVFAKNGKNKTASTTQPTQSVIAQGDHVFVNGTVSGTNVTAKVIIDGMMMPMMGKGDGKDGNKDSNKDTMGGGKNDIGSSTHPMPEDREGSSTRPTNMNGNPGGPMMWGGPHEDNHFNGGENSGN